PAADGIDRHPDLAAEAGRQREDGCARGRRERTLARERLTRVEAGTQRDQRARDPLDDPEAAALPLGERGDREVRVALEERQQVAREVGVAEEQGAGQRRSLAGR